jgi:hypothetical protein
MEGLKTVRSSEAAAEILGHARPEEGAVVSAIPLAILGEVALVSGGAEGVHAAMSIQVPWWWPQKLMCFTRLPYFSRMVETSSRYTSL